MPAAMREALITVLLKPSRVISECASYRSLSLINVDAKILAKILADRLSLNLIDFIGTDQIGFIPTRNTTQALLYAGSILW